MHWSRAVAPVLVACLLVLAGCTLDPGGSAVPTAGDSLAAGDADFEVTVTEVIDGDTVTVRFANGTLERVRLIGVDTPETRGENSPGEFPGVPDTEAGRECLREAGHDATRFTTQALLGQEVGIAFDSNLDRRGYYGRLLVYVFEDGENVNYNLVSAGQARVYDSPFRHRDAFDRAAAAARSEGRGLWRCADDPTTRTATPTESGLALTTIHADAAGDDRENLNDEYLVFANRGDDALALDGWTVTDAAGKTYTFANRSLGAGDSLTLHTGAGTANATDAFWDASGPVWNNGGDTVTVRDGSGDVVLQRAY